MNKLIVFSLLIIGAFWWMKDPTISVANGEVEFTYKVEYPAGKKSELPMLVALHGNGDTMENFYSTALDQIKEPVRVILIKAPVLYGRRAAWPSKPEDLKLYASSINEAVKTIQKKYSTTGKPLLLGFSGGAIMAYYQAVVYGETYSYIFPISGRLSREMLSGESTSSGARVYAFHGKTDRVLSYDGGRGAVDLLLDRYVDVRFTSFEGGHHGLFKEMKPEISELIDESIAMLN